MRRLKGTFKSPARPGLSLSLCFSVSLFPSVFVSHAFYFLLGCARSPRPFPCPTSQPLRFSGLPLGPPALAQPLLSTQGVPL